MKKETARWCVFFVWCIHWVGARPSGFDDLGPALRKDWQVTDGVSLQHLKHSPVRIHVGAQINQENIEMGRGLMITDGQIERNEVIFRVDDQVTHTASSAKDREKFIRTLYKRRPNLPKSATLESGKDVAYDDVFVDKSTTPIWYLLNHNKANPNVYMTRESDGTFAFLAKETIAAKASENPVWLTFDYATHNERGADYKIVPSTHVKVFENNADSKKFSRFLNKKNAQTLIGIFDLSAEKAEARIAVRCFKRLAKKWGQSGVQFAACMGQSFFDRYANECKNSEGDLALPCAVAHRTFDSNGEPVKQDLVPHTIDISSDVKSCVKSIEEFAYSALLPPVSEFSASDTNEGVQRMHMAMMVSERPKLMILHHYKRIPSDLKTTMYKIAKQLSGRLHVITVNSKELKGGTGGMMKAMLQGNAQFENGKGHHFVYFQITSFQPTTPYTKSKSPTANDIIEWVNERMEIDGSMKLFL